MMIIIIIIVIIITTVPKVVIESKNTNNITPINIRGSVETILILIKRSHVLSLSLLLSVCFFFAFSLAHVYVICNGLAYAIGCAGRLRENLPAEARFQVNGE